MTTATVLLPVRTFRERGLTLPGQSHEGWSDRFTGLGGTRCKITRPRGLAMGVSPDVMHVAVEGTDEALAFVLSCARG